MVNALKNLNIAASRETNLNRCKHKHKWHQRTRTSWKYIPKLSYSNPEVLKLRHTYAMLTY